MKLAIVLSQADPETAFNVLRLANFALNEGDAVEIFLTGKGVEIDRINDERFNVREQAKALLKAGGKFMACTKCLKLREAESSDICPFSSMADLYQLIKTADRVLTF